MFEGPKYFLIAFCIGIFLVYISEPLPEVIIKYPTPHNAGKVIYKDMADVCYVYDKREETCSKNSIDTPLQNTNKNEQRSTGIIPGFF